MTQLVDQTKGWVKVDLDTGHASAASRMEPEQCRGSDLTLHLPRWIGHGLGSHPVSGRGRYRSWI